MNLFRLILCSLVGIFGLLSSYAQKHDYIDSIAVQIRPLNSHQTLRRSIIQTMPPLLGVGLAYNLYNKPVRDLRNTYTPDFKVRYDDYLQFAPIGLQLGMQMLGVRGNSTNMTQMLVSDAIAISGMLSLVYLTKSFTKVLRPDNSANNSFPSGHTAMAFASASLFHLEYGAHYPWLSALSFASATAVGVGRILNNRHWTSDVVVGATLGYFSGQLGYWLSDLIYSQPRHYSSNKFKSSILKDLYLYNPISYNTRQLKLSDYTTSIRYSNLSLGLGVKWIYSTKGYFVQGELIAQKEELIKIKEQKTTDLYRSFGLSLGWGRYVMLYKHLYLGLGCQVLVSPPAQAVIASHSILTPQWAINSKLSLSPHWFINNNISLSLDLALSHRIGGLRDQQRNRFIKPAFWNIGSSISIRL